ncbi:hypothetical protein ABW19_dt0207353 [Dactylella cylindrospora]|nr:hypothetical protein ABW19_dt0207353 [Dactylella cylindrospora]
MSQQAQPASLAPTQVFICRHGARLDASDSSWHLTSPTPYDPPLTYGGWTQARSLGARMASLITSQISSEYPVSSTPTPKPAEKAGIWTAAGSKTGATKETKPATTNQSTIPSVSKPAASKLGNTKIIIHTSPFLRCVQTSIAVTAGMSQYFSDVTIKSEDAPGDATATSATGSDTTTPLAVHPRPILRVEGFLTEWLCEDYFTEITPPPACSLMVGTAKIDLMRPSSAGGLKKNPSATSSNTLSAPQHHHHHHGHQRAHSVGFIPPTPTSAIGKNEPIPRGHVSHAKEFCDVDYAYDSLKYGDGGEYGEEWGKMHKRVKIGFEKILKDYTDGEVKACLKGAAHGPPGGATSFEQLAASSASKEAEKGSEKGLDIPGNTILILISHGAICNALVGAMTHKPVLMDIGIASMSMGVHIPSAPTPSTSTGTTSPNPLPTSSAIPVFELPRFGISTADLDPDPLEDPLLDPIKPFTAFSPPAPPPSLSSISSASSLGSSGVPHYDVKIIASTDHLRNASHLKSPSLAPAAGSNSSGGGSSSTPPLRPRKQSTGGSAFSMYNTIGRLPAPLIGSAGSSNSNTGGGNGGLFAGGRAMGMVFGSSGGGANSSGNSGNKGPQMGVRRTASAAAATKGLWSRPIAAGEEMERGSSDEGAVMTDEESGSGEDRKEKEKEMKKEVSNQRKGSVGGMWGGGLKPGAAGGAGGGGGAGLWNSGANAEKRRRWTVTNQEDET